MNQIQITLPNEPKENLDSVLYLLQEELNIKNLILISGDNNSLILLRRKKTDVAFVMERLTEIGVGVDYGIIDIVPLSASIPEIAAIDEEKKDTPEDELKSRLSLEEINTIISDLSKYDLSFMLFLTLASIVSGAGLLADSPAVVIASMILSPFMGPILSVSYGIVIRKQEFIITGLKGQGFAIGIGFVVGLLMGFSAPLFAESPIFTDEMLGRSWPDALDVIIAICAGIAVGFSITGGTHSVLVGIAVAVALLPPMVNTGLVVALGNMDLALGSFVLMVTNIGLINLCTYIVFKVKRIQKLPQTPLDWVGPEESFRTRAEEKEPKRERWKKYAFWR